MREFQTFISDKLGLEATLCQGNAINGQIVDDSIIIKIGKIPATYILEEKKQLTSLRQLERILKKSPSQSMILLVDKLPEKIKKYLAMNNIGFFENSRSYFLPLSITNNSSLLRGGKVDVLNELMKMNRQGVEYSRTPDSFTQIIYCLLVKPSLLTVSQQELAEMTKLSIGTINRMFKMLESQGFIVKTHNKYKTLARKKDLFERWRYSIKDFGFQKLSLGTFSSVDRNIDKKWRTFDIERYKASWGGEPAVAIKDEYLRPAHFAIYTRVKISPLLRQLKLKFNPAGKFHIFKSFWPEELDEQTQGKTVSDILIYSDLLNSGVDRNIEAAQRFANSSNQLKEILSDQA